MPLVRLETSVSLSVEAKAEICASLSRTCATVIGKPETYVMALVTDGVTMLHAGAPGPAAFVDVRSIGGLTPQANEALARQLCAILAGRGIPGDRVYLNFTDVRASHWGHDGATFG